MAGDKLCAERHENCKLRMDSQAADVKEKIPWRVFYWTLGIAFFLIFGSYGYTKTVAANVAEVVTKGDMKQYQEEMVKAIKEAVK